LNSLAVVVHKSERDAAAIAKRLRSSELTKQEKKTRSTKSENVDLTGTVLMGFHFA